MEDLYPLAWSGFTIARIAEYPIEVTDLIDLQEDDVPSVPSLSLVGSSPIVSIDQMPHDFTHAASALHDQLSHWGFMAVQIPHIAEHVDALQVAFREATNSTRPSLSDYSHDKVAQLGDSGNHGYFPFGSEIPRLSKGVADPKEFIHISGAMLDDLPPGSSQVLSSFPELGRLGRSLFEIGFQIAQLFGSLITDHVLPGAPNLGLSRHSSVLRIVRYRRVGSREVLAHEHSGIQMLGIQFPPSDGGLQYVLNDGTWVEPTIAGTDIVLCNIGRMLSLASGKTVRPSTHRVHRSTHESIYERFSTVLFVHPDHFNRQWSRVDDGRFEEHQHTWGEFVRESVRGLGMGAPD